MYDQLLALSYGDRVKENQRGKMAFVVDMDKKHAAEALLNSLASHHKELILQVPVYLTTLWVKIGIVGCNVTLKFLFLI